MMLTGRTYGTEEGAAMGLSQYLAEPGEGLAKGMDLAKRVIANAPLTNFGVIQALPRIARGSGHRLAAAKPGGFHSGGG